MPVSIRVDDAARRVEVELRGRVTYGDLAGLVAERGARGLMPYRVLVDCGDAASDLTHADVRALALERNRVYAGADAGPTAVVAADEVLYGMLRMYQMVADETPALYIARSRPEAEAWLEGRQW
jgi:hypothetical protein